MLGAVCMICHPKPPSDKHHAAILEIDEANKRLWRPITDAELQHERWRLNWDGWKQWDVGPREGAAADGPGMTQD